ncbi:rho-related GTP-binding protein RhoA-B-like [Ciona intestinalis]
MDKRTIRERHQTQEKEATKAQTSKSTNLTCLLCGDDGVGKHWAVSCDVYNTIDGATKKRFKTTRKINGRDCSLKYVFSTEAKYVDVILYCFRIDDCNTIQNLLTKWNPEVEKKYGGARIPTVLVGLQSDLRSHTDLSPMPINIGNDKAKFIGAEVYLECSARTGYNVRNLFDYAFGLALGNVK